MNGISCEKGAEFSSEEMRSYKGLLWPIYRHDVGVVVQGLDYLAAFGSWPLQRSAISCGAALVDMG